MKKNIKNFGLALFLLFGFFSLFSISPAEASTADTMKTQLEAAAEQGAGYSEPQDPRLTASLIIRAALGIIGIVLVCILVYAGFLWMTAGGNDEAISKAKKLILNAVIGLAIVTSAYAITAFVVNVALGGKNNQFNENLDDDFNPFN